jgi:hypothetical protein
MYEAENKIVNSEFIKEDFNYNIAIGGHGGHTGNYDNSERSKKLSDLLINKAIVKDKNGNIVRVSIDDTRLITKELIGHTSNKTSFKDEDNNVIFTAIDDPRVISKQLAGITKGRCLMKDKNENYLMVDKNDPRVLSKELVGITKGSTQSVHSNKKRGDTQRGIKKPQSIMSCILCQKTTIYVNLLRWHKNCNKINEV